MGVCFHTLKPDVAHSMYVLSGILGTGTFALPFVNAAVLDLYSGDGARARSYLEVYFEGVGGIGGGRGGRMWDEDAITDGNPCERNADRVGECVMAINNYAASLLSSKRYEVAVEVLGRAIEIMNEGEDMVGNMHFNMASAEMEMGQYRSAEESLVKAFRFKVDRGEGERALSFIIRRALMLPKVIGNENIPELREEFKKRVEGVEKFVHWQRGEGEALTDEEARTVFGYLPEIEKLPLLTVGDPIVGLQTPHFYLHYHGLNDLPLQETVGSMWISAQPLVNHMAEGVGERWREMEGAMEKGDGGRRKRVGFVSSLFKPGEPHGLLMRDAIVGLDRDLWDVTVIAIGGGEIDPYIASRADEFVGLRYFHREACETLEGLKLDMLVFLEMQNEATAHILGYGRFAPIQALVMGSPVTSGNPGGAVDYFISFERGEPRVEEDYGEQLVMFQGTGISYPKPEFTYDEMGEGEVNDMWVEEFGLSDEFKGHRKYTCGQHIFKLHPSYDRVVVGVLSEDPVSVVLLQSSREPGVTEIVKERMERSADRILCRGGDGGCEESEGVKRRILYLPRVDSGMFLNLLRYSDVVLHPFPFGGSKTSSDCFWVAGKLVVMGGVGFLRGRMARAYWAMVGGEIEEDVVAWDVEDYVRKAVRIGMNVDGVGGKVREVMEREGKRIFDDEGVRKEWYRWMERVTGNGGEDRVSYSVDEDWEIVERLRGEWRGGFDVLSGW